jgi:hypothetical protein
VFTLDRLGPADRNFMFAGLQIISNLPQIEIRSRWSTLRCDHLSDWSLDLCCNRNIGP